MSSYTGAYYTQSSDQALFGETRARDWCSFLLVTGISATFVLATFAGMFIFSAHKHDSAYIFLNVCLFLLLGSHICLAFWYRAGDLEPRFLKLLYYNTTIIILFCICTYLIMSRATETASSDVVCPVNTTVKPKINPE